MRRSRGGRKRQPCSSRRRGKGWRPGQFKRPCSMSKIKCFSDRSGNVGRDLMLFIFSSEYLRIHVKAM